MSAGTDPYEVAVMGTTFDGVDFTEFDVDDTPEGPTWENLAMTFANILDRVRGRGPIFAAAVDRAYDDELGEQE